MFKKILLLLSVLILTACTTGTNVQPTETQKVKLGVLAPLSGDAAVYGADIQKILDYQLSIVNAKAASKGYEFELAYEDGKCSGAEAVTGFQKLTDIDGINFVIGGVCSSETLAIAPIAQEKNVVVMSGLSSNPDIEAEGDFIFTFSYSDDLIGEGVAEELNSYNRVAMITEQNDFNVGIRKVILDNLDESVELVADETFPKGGSDFRNVLEKIANEKPDIIFLNPNPGVTSENLLKQLGEIPALSDVPLVSQVAYLTDVTRKETADVAEGMIIIDAPQLSSVEFEEVYEAITAEKGAIEAIGKYYTADNLDIVNVLTDSILEVGTDPVAVKDALRSNTYKGYLGNIYFGDSNFVQDIPVGRYIVKDGVATLQN